MSVVSSYEGSRMGKAHFFLFILSFVAITTQLAKILHFTPFTHRYTSSIFTYFSLKNRLK